MAKRCLVAVCHNGANVPTDTCRSLIELGWGHRIPDVKAAQGWESIDFYWNGGFPRVDAMRDSVLTMAKKEGHSHVLFLDADMIWPTDVLMRMLRHADDNPDAIVCGLYVLRSAPYAPVAMGGRFRADNSEVDQFYHKGEYEDAPVEVDVVGMGCTLVPMAVLEKIGPRPWFEYKNSDDGWPCVTEDVPFCLKAKDAGFRVLLDPTVKCGHIQQMVLDERWHKRYQYSVAESQKRVTVVASVEPVEAA